MNVERWGMSEQAQGETKWRLGERARVRVYHGHARERGQPVAPTRKWRTTSSHDFDLRRAEDPLAQVRVDDFVQQPLGQVFFVVITVSVDGKEA